MSGCESVSFAPRDAAAGVRTLAPRLRAHISLRTQREISGYLHQAFGSPSRRRQLCSLPAPERGTNPVSAHLLGGAVDAPHANQIWVVVLAVVRHVTFRARGETVGVVLKERTNKAFSRDFQRKC